MATTKDEGPADTGTTGNRTVMFGPHVVALVDFLGQSSELAKWDFSPNTPEDSAKWMKAVRASMGRVMTWRDEFEKQFNQFGSRASKPPPELASGMPLLTKRRLDEYCKSSLEFAHFSDTIVVYSQLLNAHRFWQSSNVLGILVVCGVLELAGFTSGVVLRGAVDVGMLSRFPRTGDPYGPALANVHRLESKCADYPRIVVGPGVLSYLAWIERQPERDGPAAANRSIASICREYITQDADGCWIVDYLGDAFTSTGDEPAGWCMAQAQAFAFVQSELARFRKDGNEKLVKRYERLEAYFRTRCPAGASPTPIAPNGQV